MSRAVEAWRNRTKAKHLSDRDIITAYLLAFTNYSKNKIDRILKLYDELPEA